MFAKGELVVYGGNGVCTVTDITRMTFQGTKESKFYYVLQPYYRKTAGFLRRWRMKRAGCVSLFPRKKQWH